MAEWMAALSLRRSGTSEGNGVINLYATEAMSTLPWMI